MNQMDDNRELRPAEARLDALFRAYREACPDPEGGPEFMPRLWEKIERRRSDSTRVFRRLAEICVMATVALTLLMGAVLIPRIQAEAFFANTYAEELAAENTNADYADFLVAGDMR